MSEKEQGGTQGDEGGVQDLTAYVQTLLQQMACTSLTPLHSILVSHHVQQDKFQGMSDQIVSRNIQLTSRCCPRLMLLLLFFLFA
jgi:hypothetical protein